MNNTKTLAINIPADGFFIEILAKANGDFSEENCTRILKAYIDKHLEAKPDIILLNVCYRRALTPSNVFDSYLYNIEYKENGEVVKTLSPTTEAWSKYFASFFTCARVLMEKGIDVFAMLTRYIRDNGCKVFLSLRMNDGHFTDDPAINSSFAMQEGGKHTLDKDGVSLDFSQKEVQDYFYRYIKELLETYPADGIEIDWLRHPTVLPAELRSDFSILTDYMKSIRELMDSYDKNLSLAVRVLPNEGANLHDGVDACQWIADGIIDTVTIENFYLPTNFDMPVSKWRESIDRKNAAKNPYTLLCGTDWGVSCVAGYEMPMTPALVRGFVNDCLAKGADGIYLFNFFEEDNPTALELAFDDLGAPYLKNCFAERMKAVRDFEALPRRHVHIDYTNQRYPIAIAAGGCYQFTQQLRPPFDKCKLIVGCDQDVSLSVAVNNLEQLPLENETAPAGFEYIPRSEIGKCLGFIHAVSQVAPYVKTAILPAVSNAEITVQNNSEQPVNILWLEFSFA